MLNTRVKVAAWTLIVASLLSGQGSITTITSLAPRGLIFSQGAPNSIVLTTGSTSTVYQTVMFPCLIHAWDLLVDTGTITVVFWQAGNGTAIPTVANSFSNSGLSISSGTKLNTQTNLSDFKVGRLALHKGDTVAMNITAVSGAHYVVGQLECQ